MNENENIPPQKIRSDQQITLGRLRDCRRRHLVGATSAEADIIYSGPVNYAFHLPPVGGGTFKHFALTGGASLDFNLLHDSPGGVALFKLGQGDFFRERGRKSSA